MNFYFNYFAFIRREHINCLLSILVLCLFLKKVDFFSVFESCWCGGAWALCSVVDGFVAEKMSGKILGCGYFFVTLQSKR